MNAVEFEDVWRAYRRGVDVLAGISLTLPPGQVVGLLGKNGAGKTTLLRIAMGMLAVQRGRVRLLGLDPRQDAVALKRRVGYVAEDQILPPFLRVGELMALHRGLFPTWDDTLAGQLVGRFELPTDSRIQHLSKGQARRTALVCAVAHRPEILLLDEPASGLDPAARREFLETAIQLLDETGCTILFSTHYMSDVERMADRIVMLHEGKILVDNPLEELLEGFSLALVPHGVGVTRESLLGVDQCIAVRERPEAFHAILRLQPVEARGVLARRLEIAEIHCRAIALEDMFVELVGGRS
jgi:ABC-type multidrug transport system ATPase subunit